MPGDEIKIETDDIIIERRRRIFSFRNLFFLIVSLLLIFLLLKNTNLTMALAMMGSINWIYVLLSAVLYLISNILKAIRFYLMLHGEAIKPRDLFVIVSYQNFFNLILPARTGELTYIYYLKKIAGIKIFKGAHSLVLSRVIDLFIVAALFITAGLLYRGMNSSPVLIFSAFIVMGISLVLTFKFNSLILLCRRIIEFVTSKTGLSHNRIISKTVASLDVMVSEINSYSSFKNYILVIITSLVIWLNLYFIFFINIYSFTTSITYLQTLVGATGAVLTNVLPVNSFGSFGTLEAGWSGGFMLVGMPMDVAVTTGFGSHLIMLFSAAVIAAGCKFYRSFFSRRKVHAGDAESKGSQ